MEFENLGKWSGEDPFIKAKDPGQIQLPYKALSLGGLPVGFGFDKNGFVVQEEYAVTRPEGYLGWKAIWVGRLPGLEGYLGWKTTIER